LLAALRLNGQILGTEHPVARTPDGFLAPVMLPERNALSFRHHNAWVNQRLQDLRAAGLARPRIQVVGRDLESAVVDRCKMPSSYILFTTYLDLESPLFCGDCWRPVPLYRIPHTGGGEYYNILSWQSDYQACDTLQMNGIPLGAREMSRVNSRLSRSGQAICRHIEQCTGVPVYYYLYRGHGRDRASEFHRRCPGCGASWHLPEPWHFFFAFRCEPCRLLSNVAFDLR
jgi:predicted  nucleic acid-binding Zn ribbon protein